MTFRAPSDLSARRAIVGTGMAGPYDSPELPLEQLKEGDLIVGAVGRSAIGTVERASRYVMLVHLPAERTAEAVRDGLIRSLGALPQALRRSLIWDQGAEMSEHHALPDSHRHARVLLRSRSAMATGYQRKYERAAWPTPPSSNG